MQGSTSRAFGTAQPAQTFNTTATSDTVTGLTNGTSYTFRVAAINATGTGPYSTAPAIKVGTPLAPTSVHATGGAAQATLSWTAGANNGSASGISYTFKVAAINAIGTGPQSSASNAVTPT